jgi:hypothetical protein
MSNLIQYHRRLPQNLSSIKLILSYSCAFILCYSQYIVLPSALLLVITFYFLAAAPLLQGNHYERYYFITDLPDLEI